MKKIFYIIIPLFIIAAAVSAKFLLSPLFFSPLNKGGDDGGIAEAAATKSGLVGHWTMDRNDINGTKIYDKSGKNNHGTLTGATTSVGVIKQALSFNGTSNYVSAHGAAFPFLKTTPFSGSAWIKTSSVNNQTVFSNWNIWVTPGWIMNMSNPVVGKISFILTNAGGTNYEGQTGSTIVNDNKWHLVVFTYDGSNVPAGVKLFVDGKAETLTEWSLGTKDPGTLVNNSFEIGKVNYAVPYYFSGSIDDVRIYDRALSAQEIAQLYSATGVARENAPQKASSTPSAGNRLIGYWTMDAGDNSGGKMLDRSGMNTPGTMIGTTTSTGRIKEARTFNGTTNYISLFTSGATTSTLSPTSQVTVSAWIKLAATGSWSWIVSNASLSRNVTGGYGLHRNSSGYYAFNVNVWSQSASTGVTAVVDGKWHHLLGTYNGTTMTAYFDGVAGTPVAYSSPITYYADEIFYIGGSTVGGFQYPWNGQIDDVRVYNYGMSAQEVVNLYNSAKTTHENAATKTGLVSHWTMDNEDRSRNLIYDKSGLNNNGTLVGTTTSTGRIKEARNFNGTTDYMDMGDKSVYSISNSGLSVAGWFKTDTLPPAAQANRMWLLTKSYTNTSEWAISINSWNNFYGKLVFCHWNSAATLRTCRESNSAMVAKAWTHFVFTIADTGAVPDVYINGTLDNGTSEDMGNTTADLTTPLLIGAYPGYFENELDGLIDDIRIYNRVISAQEVANLYNAAKTTFSR